MINKRPKKEKIKIATRKPQKPKPGIFDDLGKGRQQNVKHPFSEIVNFPSESVTTETHTTHPTLPNDNPSNATQNEQSENLKKPISPENDFQKVPNSITRDGVPNKLFKGTSKNTYDALYLKTRGAVKPVRTVRATKRELMKWIGVSHVTIFKHLKHLQSVGLIIIEHYSGSHEGSVYEVFIPEELQSIPADPTNTTPSTTHPIPSYPIPYNKVVRHPYNFVVWDIMGNPIENKDTYKSPKTSLKTNTKNDDEAFAAMLTLMEIGKGKPEDWRELAELLKMEFEIAASRTKTISNAPAFLTEHLRRRLMLSEKENVKARSDKTSEVRKQQFKQSNEEVELDQPEPLTKEGRESTLKSFAEYIKKGQKEFILSLRETYTAEDWEWLIDKVEISASTPASDNESNA